ncbi:MAG: hypothetical protein M3R69_00960 [Acidobacteriota bacterium]|nr:hypothetical protein [Acidobacteriota bacterium]
MYESFEECFRALLEDEGLDNAQGGQVIKQDRGFDYKLHHQPEVEGDIFLELNPSSTPEVKWRVLRTTREADEAYQAFISDQQNGVHYEILSGPRG